MRFRLFDALKLLRKKEVDPKKEEEMRKKQQAVLECVLELQKKNNFPQFEASVYKMFAFFGFDQFEDNERYWNREMQQQAYDYWHTHGPNLGRKFIDIQIRTSEKKYANMYIGVGTYQGKRILFACPGTCSILDTNTYNIATYNYIPEPDYFRTFSREIGIFPGNSRIGQMFIVNEKKFHQINMSNHYIDDNFRIKRR